MSAYDDTKAAEIGALRGTILEIGAGRGRNFGALHPGVTWIGSEPNRRLRNALAADARRLGHAAPLDAAAESLPLPDASVDAVLATVVLCSVSDQARVLAEIARVLRPGGEFVFAEHVGGPPGSRTRAWQRTVAPVTRAFDHGCDPTRETEAAIRDSRLQIVRVSHFDLPALGPITAPYIVGRARL